MSAKVMTLPAKTNVCQLQEVKVLRSEKFDKADSTPLSNNPPLKTTHVNQHSVEPDTALPKVDLVGAKLSPEERVKVEQVLKKVAECVFEGSNRSRVHKAHRTRGQIEGRDPIQRGLSAYSTGSERASQGNA